MQNPRTESEVSKIPRKKPPNKSQKKRKRIILESSDEEGEEEDPSKDKEKDGSPDFKHTGDVTPVGTPTWTSARLANRRTQEFASSPSSNSSSWQEQDYNVDISSLSIMGSHKDVGTVSLMDKTA